MIRMEVIVVGGAFLLAIWSAFAFVTAQIAGNKGESAVKWGLYGFLLPIVAIPHALMLKEPDRRPRCRSCYEPVHAMASICPHCRSEDPIPPRSYGVQLQG